MQQAFGNNVALLCITWRVDTSFCKLTGDATVNTFLSEKKTKSIARPKTVSFSKHGIWHHGKDTISWVHVSPGSAETLVRKGGITNHHLIAQSQEHLCQKLPKSADVHRSYSVLHHCRFFETQCIYIYLSQKQTNEKKKKRETIIIIYYNIEADG